MNVWDWVVLLISFGVAVLALSRALSLKKDVKRLTRNEYYRDGRMRELSQEWQGTIETLRIQVAHLAGGHLVPEDLIRSGRLYRDVTPEAVAQLLVSTSSEDFRILDVQALREYAVKHLPSALSIPLEELEARCESELPNTKQTLIVYCAAGDRSQLACDFLSRRGYASVQRLLGGLQQWTGPTEGMGNVQLVQIQSRSKGSQDKEIGEKLSSL